jgi:hypothetical protein
MTSHNTSLQYDAKMNLPPSCLYIGEASCESTHETVCDYAIVQGILKGEVSLYQ